MLYPDDTGFVSKKSMRISNVFWIQLIIKKNLKDVADK